MLTFFEMNIIKLSLALGLGAISSQTWACPLALRNVHSNFVSSFQGDLCALADATAQARSALAAQGIDSRKLVGARAGRFINLPDWQKANAAGKFDPTTVYEPAPSTWSFWAAAAVQVDAQAASNANANILPVFSIDQFRAINLMSLPPSEKQWGGKVRGYGEEVGDKALDRETAPTEEQLTNLGRLEYRDLSGQPIVSFTPTICLDEASPEVRKSFENRREGNPADLARPGSWFMIGGKKRHCGLLQYAPAMQISSQLKGFFLNVNGLLSKMQVGAGGVDPVWLAARTQRWLVSIHPFVAAGNGRTSRFAMDTIIESLGLPAPVIPADMNTDIYNSESQWASYIGAGIDNAYMSLQNCIGRSALVSPLCKIVE